MADTLESLELEVKYKATGAAGEIAQVTNAISGLGAAVAKVLPQLQMMAKTLESVGGTKNVAHTVQQIGSAAKSAAQATAPVSDSLQEMISGASEVELLQYKLDSLTASMQQAFDSGDAKKAAALRAQIVSTEKALERAGKSASNASKGVKELAKEASKSQSPLNGFLSSLKRIAFYRIIRGIIKSITQAFQEGLQNAYAFSQGIKSEGHRFATALDGMSTASLKMKNQLGSAFIGLLAAIAPVVNAIISLATRAASAITQLFAALGGKGTYLKAIDYAKEWAETTAGGAAAAKEWRNQLMGFDEINRLDEPNKGGGGGGASLPDYENMFKTAKLEDFWQKVSDLTSNFKINFQDVFFDWEDINPEQIGKKLIVGLAGVLGGVTGFMIGGVPGAIVGTLVGVALGLEIDSLIFNNDGVLNGNEVADMIRLALFALVGGIIGFTIGGPGGALLGASVGVGLFAGLKAVDFFTDGKASGFINQLATALSIFAGAAIGFFVGGPAGALLGAAIGLGVAATITDIEFNVKDNPERSKYKSGLDWFTVGILGLPSDEQWSQWGSNVVGWIADGFRDFGTELSLIFVSPIENALKDVFGEDTFSNLDLGKWFNEHVAPWFTASKWQELGNKAVQSVKNTLNFNFSPIADWFNTKVAPWFTASKWQELGQKAIQGIKNGLSSLSLPKFHLTWGTSYKSFSVLGKTLSMNIPWPSLSFYREGGFPDAGQLFVAREAGPELVGTMGGRNAVANNDQIIEGIRQGVYDAVRAAMGSVDNGGGETVVRVYLDSREIAAGQRSLAIAQGV